MTGAMHFRFLFAADLDAAPALRDSMFRDRAAQFIDRLGWDLERDHRGWERDEYDACNPLYVAAVDDEGVHGGSMRLLPTVGRTMLNEHFRGVLGGRVVRAPDLWEVTRLCLSPGAGGRTTAGLFLAGWLFLQGFDLRGFAGVYDARMRRVHARMGWTPRPIASLDWGGGEITVGAWLAQDADCERLEARADLSADSVRRDMVRDLRPLAAEAVAV